MRQFSQFYRWILMGSLFLLLLIGGVLSLMALAGEDEALTPEVQELIEKGMEQANAQEYEKALFSFRNAFLKVPDAFFYQPPPGLIFNLALAEDKAPGRLLPAAIWYKVYAELAPDDPKTPQIKRHADHLLETFDQYVMDMATLLEQSLGQVQTLSSKRESLAPFVTENRSQYQQGLEEDRSKLEKALVDIQAARISVDDEETAFKKLRHYGILSNNETLEVHLAAAGHWDDAKKYSKDEAAHAEIISLMREIKGNYAKSCQAPVRQRQYILMALDADKYTQPYNYRIDDPAILKDMKIEADYQLYPGVFLGYTDQLRALALQRRFLSMLETECP